MKKLALLIIFLPILAHGEPTSWLKKEEPNDLFVYTDTHGYCPLSDDQVTEVVSGVLIRARIQPLANWTANELSLYVYLTCPFDTASPWMYSVSVQFAQFSPWSC